jgi:plasmid stabilization system protein ParE
VGPSEVKRRIIFRAQARADLIEALDWYRDSGVAHDFLRTFEATLNVIQQNPFQYQTIGKRIRRAPLQRFPYGIMYSVSDEELVILTCFHGRRDPMRWRKLK